VDFCQCGHQNRYARALMDNLQATEANATVTFDGRCCNRLNDSNTSCTAVQTHARRSEHIETRTSQT
jgi:hypothetical protein